MHKLFPSHNPVAVLVATLCRTYRETHYRFCNPLVAQMLFLDVPDDQKHRHFEKILALNDPTLEIIELVLISISRHKIL